MNHRKHIRLQHYNYSSPGAYFVTLVTRLRAPLFGYIKNEQLIPTALGQLAEQQWLLLPSRLSGLQLDKFIIMPNHLHGLIWLDTEKKYSLSKVIAFYKAGVSRISHQKIWQHNFYERIIRDESELHFTRQYIEQNPLRWELDRYYEMTGSPDIAQ